MKSSDERGELLFFDVLQLVDEEDERGASGFGGGADGFDERLQVVFEIAVVRQARLRFEVDADLDVIELQLETSDEARERAESALGERFRFFIAG